MQTVKASVILDDAYRLIGWDAAQVDSRDKADARDAFSQAVQTMWEAWWWHELMIVQQLQLANSASSGASIPSGRTVFQASDDTYYTALVLVDPPSLPSTNAGSYEAFNYQATGEFTAWDSTKAYVQLDQVSYAGTNYQARTTVPVGTVPTNSTYWYAMVNWIPLIPVVNADIAGTQIAPFGMVRSVSRYDPRRAESPQYYTLDNTLNGTRVLGMSVTHPWVMIRRPTPVITGDDYATTSTYEAVATQDIIFDS